MDFYILLGIGLAIYALAVTLTAKRKPPHNANQNAGRSGTRPASHTPAQPQIPRRSSTPPPLPPRSASSSNIRVRQQLCAGTGPRGIRPSQFPCCPKCRQRNDGPVQKIFWNSGKNQYSCSRGHKFAQNGKLIIS